MADHYDKLTEKFPHVPERISGLIDLAYNLWWSWTPEAQMLFKQLSPHAWIESIHNPVRMLRDLPVEMLERAARSPQYMRHYDLVISRFRQETSAKNRWFSEQVSNCGVLPIAYFSAEYGLHHSLPFYAGGLGFLSGDHLKESSDLGIPMVAIGFMYCEGYLHQHIKADGWQEDIKEVLDRDASPVTRVMVNAHEQLVVRVPFFEPSMHVAVWKVDVGRIPLFLLDTDIKLNRPEIRCNLSRLYTGDVERRLHQEIILGIGGCAVLDKLGIQHSAIHINEGHPAFALLERIRKRVEGGMTFEQAMQTTRRTNIFTTHTSVPAGHDLFPHSLMDKYFNLYYELLGIDRNTFLELGHHPRDPSGLFNMTALGLKMSDYRNAVSRQHGVIARRMWQTLWPDIPEDKVPIEYITNGVHLPTWLDPKMELLFNSWLGRFYPKWMENHDDPSVWELLDEIPDWELWQTHQSLKRQLLNRIREYKRWKWAEGEMDPTNIVAGGVLLDPNILTIGFARRFATYKRADLIFLDPERLKRIVTDRWRPVQIIFAGKAHPADKEGNRMLQRVYQFAHRTDFGGRIAFVEDYGEQNAQYLVHGVDLWLNTPEPMMEASGTSGMKASLNGVPHMSVPAGWWIEGFNKKNGWMIGDESHEGERDWGDACRIYDLLEKKVVPLYYTVSEDGTPHSWIRMMKEAIKSSAPRFSARRMVKEYALRYYTPALKACETECVNHKQSQDRKIGKQEHSR